MKAPQDVESLLSQAYERIPGFTLTLYATGKHMPVMMNWTYDFRAPMSEWARSRPAEMFMGGMFPNVTECLLAILNRVDRYDSWVIQSKSDAARADAVARMKRTARQAPVEKNPEADEGEEVVAADELPEVTPLTSDLASGDTDASTAPSSYRPARQP
jgi:hypothetical protein